MTSWSGSPPSRSKRRRIVSSGTRPRSRSERSSSRGSSCGNEPDRPVEQADENEEGRQPLAQRGEFRIVGVRCECRRGFALLLLEDGDDRVALADLSLGDDPTKPLPVVTDREIGGPRRSAAPDPARLRDALDDPPRFGLGEGQARGAVAEAKRLADLAFGERLLAGHQIGLDPGDRRGHAPGRAHVAPGLGELDPDGLGRPARRAVANWRHGAIRRVRTRTGLGNLRFDSRVFWVHNLLCESSSLGNGMTTDFPAHAEPAHRPIHTRLGALAGITPVVMSWRSSGKDVASALVGGRDHGVDGGEQRR